MKKGADRNSTVLKAIAIETEFFSLIGRLNDQTLHQATPNLIKLLQRYDRLLGFGPQSAFMTVIDVRLFYAIFGRLKEADPKTRLELMKGTQNCFARDQIQAINRARLRPVKAQELKPIALIPVFRAGS
jgi:hypothetical protein